jgi:iron-sulfur cluster repair protein YtfE (RIC family)
VKDKNVVTISDFLNADHRRLDAIWADCCAAIGSGDIDKLRARFPEFDSGLRRHIRVEEDVLFPAFEESTGMGGGGPTAVMRAEHQEIQAFLDRIGALAKGGGGSAVMQAGASHQAGLTAVLHAHNLKEENILYPMSDQIFAGEEKTALLARIQNDLK